MAFTGAGCRRRGHRLSAADGAGATAGDIRTLNCFIGLLPLATAIFAVIRGGERPRPAFWGFSLLGSLLVASFALAGNVGISVAGDLLMLAAVVVCGLGYAEGRLTRELGGLAVICWALFLSLP